jgi:inhibitor of KinA sporulation pathway (predicted exonuclease)
MKAETFTLLALTSLVIFIGHLYVRFTSEPPKLTPPCKDFHNCRIIQVDTDGDSATYSAILTDTCRHSHLVQFKAEADRFNAGDTAQGNFFGQSK